MANDNKIEEKNITTSEEYLYFNEEYIILDKILNNETKPMTAKNVLDKIKEYIKNDKTNQNFVLKNKNNGGVYLLDNNSNKIKKEEILKRFEELEIINKKQINKTLDKLLLTEKNFTEDKIQKFMLQCINSRYYPFNKNKKIDPIILTKDKNEMQFNERFNIEINIDTKNIKETLIEKYGKEEISKLDKKIQNINFNKKLTFNNIIENIILSKIHKDYSRIYIKEISKLLYNKGYKKLEEILNKNYLFDEIDTINNFIINNFNNKDNFYYQLVYNKFPFSLNRTKMNLTFENEDTDYKILQYSVGIRNNLSPIVEEKIEELKELEITNLGLYYYNEVINIIKNQENINKLVENKAFMLNVIFLYSFYGKEKDLEENLENLEQFVDICYEDEFLNLNNELINKMKNDINIDSTEQYLNKITFNEIQECFQNNKIVNYKISFEDLEYKFDKFKEKITSDNFNILNIYEKDFPDIFKVIIGKDNDPINVKFSKYNFYIDKNNLFFKNLFIKSQSSKYLIFNLFLYENETLLNKYNNSLYIKHCLFKNKIEFENFIKNNTSKQIQRYFFNIMLFYKIYFEEIMKILVDNNKQDINISLLTYFEKDKNWDKKNGNIYDYIYKTTKSITFTLNKFEYTNVGITFNSQFINNIENIGKTKTKGLNALKSLEEFTNYKINGNIKNINNNIIISLKSTKPTKNNKKLLVYGNTVIIENNVIINDNFILNLDEENINEFENIINKYINYYKEKNQELNNIFLILQDYDNYSNILFKQFENLRNNLLKNNIISLNIFLHTFNSEYISKKIHKKYNSILYPNEYTATSSTIYFNKNKQKNSELLTINTYTKKLIEEYKNNVYSTKGSSYRLISADLNDTTLNIFKYLIAVLHTKSVVKYNLEEKTLKNNPFKNIYNIIDITGKELFTNKVENNRIVLYPTFLINKYF